MAGVSQEGDVGVPPAGPVHLAVDGQHLAALVDGGQHGVRLGDGAELAGEVGLLLGRQRLVAEEDDVMGVQRVADAPPPPRGPAAAEMSTPEISAPMVGERGWTLTEVARVTAQLLPERPAAPPSRHATGRSRGPPTLAPRHRARRPTAIGPRREKGPSMSDDTGGLVLTPPARNYSPWYQWMARLAATDPRGPAPRGRPRGHPGLGGALPRPPDRAPRARARSPSRSTSRPSSRWTATATGGTRSSSTPRTPCRSRPTCSSPTSAPTGAPGAAVLACHGHGPGKSQVVGLEHTDMPNADYALQLARRGYVVLAPDLRCFGERLDWNPEDHYACDTNLVHAVMAGLEPAGPERLGPAALPRRPGAAPARRPGPHRHGRHLLRRAPSRSSPPPSTTGWRRRW